MSRAGGAWVDMSRTKRLGLVGGVTMLVGGASLIPFVSNGGATATNDEEAPQSAQTETELATVTRGDLVEEVDVNGTVGFGDAIALPVEAQGIVTETRASGDMVAPGEVLLRVADKPVYLVQGSQPLYRELRRVLSSERDAAGDKRGLQVGADVEQLQRFLIGAGFDDKGRLDVDGTFGLTTQRAVKDWQRSVGHPATGSVDRSQMVFVSGPVRVESAPRVGQNFSDVSVTSGSPVVSMTVSAKQKLFFDVGAAVQVESIGVVVSGTVVKQERTVGDDGTSGYRIEVELDEGEELGDAEAVRVEAKRVKAAGVLTVPVRALIALAEGGWAVQLDTPAGIELTAVELGDVVDGIAEISGVEEDASVVVPV